MLRIVDGRKEAVTFSAPTSSRNYVRKKRKLPHRSGTLCTTTQKKNADMASVARQMNEGMFAFGEN